MSLFCMEQDSVRLNRPIARCLVVLLRSICTCYFWQLSEGLHLFVTCLEFFINCHSRKHRGHNIMLTCVSGPQVSRIVPVTTSRVKPSITPIPGPLTA